MADEVMEFMIASALRIGVPADVLEEAKDAVEVRAIMERWLKCKKMDQIDQKRIKEGLSPLRTKIMHLVSEPEDK